MDRSFRLFPEQASTVAGKVDSLYFFLIAVSGFFTLLIFVLIVYFALKYRRKSERRPPEVPTNYKLEMLWTVIPLVLVMVMFIWGAKLYVHMSVIPTDAMEIHVVGRQWMWKIQHPTGRRETNELHVPLGRPIKLTMGSEDVIHAFFIPAFRIKNDVIPGRYTTQWFEATQVGEYHLFCAEYCGAEHWKMIGKVVVMEPAKYEAWLAGAIADDPPVLAGEKLFTRYSCATCHGERGPTMAGLYGKEIQLQDGSRVIADEQYLRESILNPSAKMVAGFPPIMPSYQGQLSEEQLMQLITYIKSLGDARTGNRR